MLACTASSILVPYKIQGSNISWLAAILPVFFAFAFQTLKYEFSPKFLILRLFTHRYYLRNMEAESSDIFDFHSMAAHWARVCSNTLGITHILGIEPTFSKYTIVSICVNFVFTNYIFLNTIVGNGAKELVIPSINVYLHYCGNTRIHQRRVYK